jgi:hypothetical protein
MLSSIAFDFGRGVFEKAHDASYCGGPGFVHLDSTASGGLHFTLNTAYAQGQADAGKFDTWHRGAVTRYSAEALDWIGKHTESMQSSAVSEACARQVLALRQGGSESTLESVGDLELQVQKLEGTADNLGSIWSYDIYIRDRNTTASESGPARTTAASY